MTVRILLKGEESPRTFAWDREDLTMLADLDHAVPGGMACFDRRKLWHLLALFWVTGARDMTLREFAKRLPITTDRMGELFEAGELVWPTITS